MNETSARGSVALTLRARRPAYSVMQECLRVQAAAQGLTRWQRLVGRSPLVPDAVSWFKGALGEIEVARVLGGLGPDWTVLHSVPVGSGASDIDHVAIGPGGVFSINTKHHPGKKIWVGGGTVMVDGHRTSHARNSLFEARRASSLLSAAAGTGVEVVPVIVLVDPGSVKFGDKAPTVRVVTASQLGVWLLSLPRVHSAEALAYLTMIAEERSTWHTEALDLTDTLRHEHRFERLCREIEDASRRRRRWRIGTRSAALIASAGLVVTATIAFTATLGAIAG